MSSGNVIRTLRASPLATVLSEPELRALANCGRVYEHAPGAIVLSDDGQDERLFILRRGRVALSLSLWTEGVRCGGETTIELTCLGQPFGWATWMRPDRLKASAHAQTRVSIVALDLARLGDTQTFLKMSNRILQLLYGRLQEYGLCPPNLQALVRMKNLMIA